MSDAASAMGMPIVLSFDGKDYPVSPLDIDAIAMYERWLENRAFETVSLRKHTADESDYKALLSVWVEQCVGGVFRYGGDVAERAARSIDGQRFLAFLALAKGTPGMTQKLAAKIYDTSAAEMLAKLEVVNAGPFDTPAE